MNLITFIHKYPSEDKCLDVYAKTRLEQGIECRKCGHQTKHHWCKSIKRFQCADCRTRTSYKANTMMHKSKISIQKWFMLIHLMTSIKKSMSALEVSRQLDTRYDTIFHAMQKIRCLMGKRDSRYQLSGTIEMDDAFFVAVDYLTKDEELKRGRGSQRTAKVLVMVESEYTGATEEKVKRYGKASDHKKNRRMGYAKMIVVDDLSAETINYEVRKHLKSTANVIADKWRGYNQVGNIINSIKQTEVKPKDAMKKLPYVHTIISNAKRMTGGIHHSVFKTYLQNYLNEFCYKLNRRNFTRDMFDGMLKASVNDTWF